MLRTPGETERTSESIRGLHGGSSFSLFACLVHDCPVRTCPHNSSYQTEMMLSALGFSSASAAACGKAKHSIGQ